MGVVPVVRDIGWFSELPDSVCVKVKTENQVADVLIELIKPPSNFVLCPNT